jgi:hypothetical protein
VVVVVGADELVGVGVEGGVFTTDAATLRIRYSKTDIR